MSLLHLRRPVVLSHGLRRRSACIRRRSSVPPNLPLDISEEVEHALQHGLPTLALESAIITHGLPFQFASELPTQLEDLARASGVVPAHVAILGGRVKVGLNRAELAILADPSGKDQRWKVGRRELPGAVASKVSHLLGDLFGAL